MEDVNPQEEVLVKKKAEKSGHLISAFSEDNGKLSGRRVLGTIGFLAFMVSIFIPINHEMLGTLGWISAGLLGLTTIDKFAK